MKARKEKAMSLKSEVSSIASRIGERADELLPDRDEAQKIVTGWTNRGRQFARQNPGTTIVGAFAVGFLLAKAARHA
jgi:hypothetical protein